MSTYTYKENNGQYEIHVEGVETIRPIRTLATKELAEMWVEDMNKVDELGWENGSQLGYKINELEFDEIEFAVLRAVYSSISDSQTLDLINKRIKLEETYNDNNSELLELLKETFECYKDDKGFFMSIYEKFN